MSLRFAGVFGFGVAALVAVFLGVVAWKLYRRQGTGRRLSWILPLLRSAAILLTAAILTGPELAGRETEGEPGRVVVLLDGSRSMGLGDSRDGEARWKRAERALLDPSWGVVPSLARRHEVELRVARGAAPEIVWRGAPGLAGEPPRTLPGAPSGDRTNLAGLIEAALPTAGGRRAALLLLSDGRHNDGPSPLAVAAAAGARGVPVHAVVIGHPAPRNDVAVLDVRVPDSVFFKDRVQGEVVIRDRVPPGEEVTLVVESDGQVVWQQTATSRNADARTVPFDFPVQVLVEAKAAKAGAGVTISAVPLEFRVRIAAARSDEDAGNNEREFFLRAVRDRRKALILEGWPRWEFRYLRNLFERDPQWDEVNALSAPPGQAWPRGDGPGRFPADRVSLLGYDLIIFGQVPPGALAARELEWIHDFVDRRGGGLVFLDGPQGALSSYRGTALGPLLPVSASGRPAPPTALRASSDLACLRLASAPGESTRRWASLPAPHAVAGVATLPGSEVWVEALTAGGPVPYLVHRRVGAGRVLYSAGDETWRWRSDGGAAHHRRFWNQAAREIMEESFAVRDDRLSLDVEKLVMAPEETTEVRARIRDERGRPLEAAAAEAWFFRDGKKVASAALETRRGSGGLYRARGGSLPVGRYEVRVHVDGVPDAALRPSAEFWVRAEPSPELAELHADEALLREIASRSGGKCFLEDQAGDAVAALEPVSRVRVKESRHVVWQSAYWFVAILGILTAEWAVRKWAGLL